MPYKSVRELPESVRDNLPKHAQELYQEAFNSAWEQYDEPEERRGGASRVETARGSYGRKSAVSAVMAMGR